jgi:uncharacterized protein (DUF433 family)
MEPAQTMPVVQTHAASTWPAAERARIISTDGVCGGRPRIDGHRLTVEDVAIWHERMGMSPDEIVSAHPSITLADVHAALAYYFEHRERIDQAIAEGERFVAEMKAQAPPSLLQQKLQRMCADAADDSVSSR